eukprot:TRINITY_DN6347_c0_g1_i2.p1 TRINITY_DN6347_c0_g1~~TRINITY_DN6347_c0_g1_i2.p1  ORF type:complete len:291 (+),score=46.61 TRINITY_DN6347_c0_g1_i2:259-1131(+)
MLASVDPKGNGFAQKYGYFEMSARLPGGAGMWPAFWLDDVDSVKNRHLNAGEEIDILEQYDNSPGLHTTIHYWNSKPTGVGSISTQCDMFEGWHTYGLDLQPDYLTFYYDRVAIWQVPNKTPGVNDTYNREMYVMVDLAYRTGSDKPPAGFIDDMLVQYVRVWQGSGGSAKAFDFSDANSHTWESTQLKIFAGDKVSVKNIDLFFNETGDLQLKDSKGDILWHSETTCTNKCYAYFQNDGNFVILDQTGKAYWASNTWGNNMGVLVLSNESPFLRILDGSCNKKWSPINN